MAEEFCYFALLNFFILKEYLVPFERICGPEFKTLQIFTDIIYIYT